MMQLDDVGVRELAENLDLLEDLLAKESLSRARRRPPLDDELGRVLLAIHAVLAAAHDRELARAQVLVHFVCILK